MNLNARTLAISAIVALGFVSSAMAEDIEVPIWQHIHLENAQVAWVSANGGGDALATATNVGAAATVDVVNRGGWIWNAIYVEQDFQVGEQVAFADAFSVTGLANANATNVATALDVSVFNLDAYIGGAGVSVGQVAHLDYQLATSGAFSLLGHATATATNVGGVVSVTGGIQAPRFVIDGKG